MFTIDGGILITGNLVQDTVVRPVEEIRFGGTVWVDSIEHHMGGNGANTAYAIGILGGRVALAGAVGDDAAGQSVLARLGAVGVELADIERSPLGTAASVVIVKSDGTRAFLHRPGVSREALSQELPFPRFRSSGFTHYHLANPFSLIHVRERAADFLHGAKAAGLTTSMDTAWDSKGQWMAIVEPCLPHVDLLFVNEDEARILSGASDPAEASREFRRLGAGDIVVKLGGQGARLFDGPTDVKGPAFRIDAIDTTGAGDCFTGAFLAALQRGLPAREALTLANAAGAMSASAIGGTAGLKDWDGTLRFASSHDPLQ